MRATKDKTLDQEFISLMSTLFTAVYQREILLDFASNFADVEAIKMLLDNDEIPHDKLKDSIRAYMSSHGLVFDEVSDD